MLPNVESITETSSNTLFTTCLSPFCAVTLTVILKALPTTGWFTGGIIPKLMLADCLGSRLVTGLAKPTIQPSGGNEKLHSKSASEFPSLVKLKSVNE